MGVYVIQNTENLYCKIGVTVDLPARLSGLQTGNSALLVVLTFIESGDDYTLEAALHKRYQDKRLVGEWFALTKTDIAYLLECGNDPFFTLNKPLQKTPKITW